MSIPPAEPLASSPAARPRPAALLDHDLAGTEPIRAELYGLESLEAQARELATASRIGPANRAAGPLLQRFAENGHILAQTREQISALAGRKEPLSPDAEWLLDNYYIVEEVWREVRHDLPRGYYRELPKLASAPLAGFPRIYSLALSLIAHTDSSLDESHITRYVQAYQTVVPLTIGELWAVPTMLRLGLLENLRRLAGRMLATWQEHRRAEAWVSPLMAAGREGRPLPVLSSPSGDFSDAFVVRAFQVLRNEGPPAALEQVEADLAARGIDIHQVVRRENQQKAVNQVSVGNSVTSLRLLGALDWSSFFETTNLVDPILREDPARIYDEQDFATRDRYRQAVERLARRSPFTEVEVARWAIDRARAAPAGSSPRDHVGYYLIGPGLVALKAELAYRPWVRQRLLDVVLDHPNEVYFGSLATVTVLLLALLGVLATGSLDAPFDAPQVALWLLAFLAALLPVSELAVGIVNYVLTLFLPPRVLPKLAFRQGIPPDCAAFVVMPSMLVRPQSTATLLERLEIHYLANPDPQLRFALLTDFADAETEHQSEDEAYVHAALEGVAALNQRYARGGPPRFFLFHRKRLWNPVQGCWMGWERKRGKLAEFNRLLRGDRGTSYTVCSSDPAELPHVRFVITLDLDTQLPHETARRLIGTLAHPLNRALFDPLQRRVTEGYGVLQPRISFHLSGTHRSRFTRIWAASAGIDPYSTAVSDIYQDMFGAGTFTGKGVYEVDAFEKTTGHTFPDNQVLSHDLIEGNFARCGLVTDIELFDDFPARYHAYARREHRWVRGDWQLLPWLGRRTPTPGGDRPNPLPLLERWKLCDNLRRSLVPPGLVLWLFLSWTVLPVSAGLAASLALLVLVLPLLLQVVGALLHSLRSRTLTPFRELWQSLPATLGQVILASVFLLNQAYLAVDAIVRTLARLYGTRRNLLEWETAAAAERRLGTGFLYFGASMWQAPLLAVLLAAVVALVHPAALPVAGCFLGLWFLSPVVAYWVSQSPPPKIAPLTPAERQELRRVARKTWSFFETFVGDEDHWLPPDNYQEEPRGQVAHRTSPTNQGLLLLSTLAVHDLGYLTLGGLLGRLEKTLDSLDRLERYRGHFYNWYDTTTLQPLPPAYVSTVDSGNLLACLVTLKQGLGEKPREPIVGAHAVAGLRDTLDAVAELLRTLKPPEEPEAAACYRELQGLVENLQHQLQDEPEDLVGWERWLCELARQANILPAQARRLTDLVRQPPRDLEVWAGRFAVAIQERQAELAEVVPWLALLAHTDAAQCRDACSRLSEDAARHWDNLAGKLAGPVRLADFEGARDALAAELVVVEKTLGAEPCVTAWLEQVREALRASNAPSLWARCRRLADRADALIAAMDFTFLYKSDRHLFAIGYHAAQGRLDAASYDLLASEARLTSYLAIARGQVPRRHWFHLGRLLTRVDGCLCLLSWGGTMFEYLMPDLLLRRYPEALLAESTDIAVARQISYGRERHVPWGISESAYSSQYASYDYQYQSFGVPGLGLKRGLDQDLVVAPYATALATMVRPHEALRNFRRLRVEGAAGRYGYYEAIDYTRKRLPEGRRSLVVRCIMAHHQGMSLLALANVLLDAPMPRRFHAEPMIRATELLLQERVPRGVGLVDTPTQDVAPPAPAPEGGDLVSRRLTTPFTPGPRTHLLSNGTYCVMVTNAGSGFSRCRDLDVSRWREDYTRDDTGQFCYIRDRTSGLLWSAGHHPVGRAAEWFEVVFSADKAEFRRLDGSITTHLEVIVSAENTAEIRRVTLSNNDSRPHDLEVTSYLELVLATHAADAAHPAFGKLFLETEWSPPRGALLCHRRPRSPEQPPVWAIHVATPEGPTLGQPELETDRARFLGRGRTLASPAALESDAPLSGTTGPVLDPIFSLRRRLRLEPGASAAVTFCTAVAGSREEALALADHFQDPHAILRAFDLAWAHSQIELRHLHLASAEAHLFQRLATPLLYAGPALRASPAVLAANRQGQSALWRHGISGDLPILLVRIGEAEELSLVGQLLAAHTYWRLKGLEVDLVILCEQPTSYLQELCQRLQDTIRSSDAHHLVDRPGGVFLRQADHLTAEDKVLLQAAARVVLVGDRGSLTAQLDAAEPSAALPPLVTAPRRRHEHHPEPGVRLPEDLLFGNGLGGFTADGREYCILLDPPAEDAGRSALTPAPWINVIANPRFGFLVSESGLGCTWAGNSQLNRLTPWHNDPLADPPAEVVYLRDEATREFWTPTPRPRGALAPTLVRHGQGYTLFQRQSHGLAQELLCFVPTSDPVKVIRLKIKNTGERLRHLSATYFAEWALGTVREQAALYLRTEVDPDTGALFAHHPFRQEHAAEVAFAGVNLRPRTLTADRTEFLGRNGSPSAPAALGRSELSGRSGAAIDPCAAFQTKLSLQPGEEKEVVFLLGAAADAAAARELLRRYQQPEQVRGALEEVKAHWEQVLTAVQVHTPDPALDLLLNRWLLYQVLSCRVWGRTAFYQSSGAYGFRDQLQDVMALVYGAPEETRAQLLRAASRQFVEGDVQHWWHPPAGRGVRTRISDDFLWLPFAVCHYVTASGDAAVLDERVPYLRAPRLQPGQDEMYGLPEIAEEMGPLYDHCVRALRQGLRFGEHGLPLMGTGDWNDGMNRVGVAGEGESVWDGWFLIACLRQFAPLAETRGDHVWAATCREHADRLRQAIEDHAWDGCWYRRAYFDDGTPLGSAENDECQIDSVVQSWAVLSGAADPVRVMQALAAVARRLVRPQDGLILLLTPPFDQGPLQPGYIKGYVPGIRENGGQYTHAATWVVQAAALLGQGARAAEWFRFLNPIHHTETSEKWARYRVEPYVVAGDVYSEPPHTGRGGWTWYTGSAAWLYRVVLESMLGFRRRGTTLTIEPCIPAAWASFEISCTCGSTRYHLTVVNPQGVERGVVEVLLDGKPQAQQEIELVNDGRAHEVRIVLGAVPFCEPC
jgi:cyclic beta-1,2-glucan synthetase